MEPDLARIRESGRLRLLGTEKGAEAEIAFTEDHDLMLHRRKSLPYHSNGMRLFAYETSFEGPTTLDAVINGDDEDDLQLCRLKDTGHPEMWGFALFTYSNERYEDNILPTGLSFGSPEDALDCAVGLYLGDPAS